MIAINRKLRLRKKYRRGIYRAFYPALMLIAALIYIYPVLLMALNSLKPFKEVLTSVLALPKVPAPENYGYVIEKMEYFRLFVNNLVITVIGIAGIGDEHLNILTKIALTVSDEKNVERLRTAKTEQEILAIIEEGIL